MVRYLMLLLLVTGCTRFARLDLVHDWGRVYYATMVTGSRMKINKNLKVESYAGTCVDEDVSPMVGAGLSLSWGNVALSWYLDYVIRRRPEPSGWLNVEWEL